jgi:hypothetical protein
MTEDAAPRFTLPSCEEGIASTEDEAPRPTLLEAAKGVSDETCHNGLYRNVFNI